MTRTICRRCGSTKVKDGWAYVPKRPGVKTAYATCEACFGKPPQRKRPVEPADDPFALHYDFVPEK